jgi:hypothetical protein
LHDPNASESKTTVKQRDKDFIIEMLK